MNQLNYLTASKDGFIWIATFEGLVRYDGSEFKTISHVNYPKMEGGAFDIEVDQSGTIWLFDTNYRRLYSFRDGVIQSWDTYDYTEVVDFTLFKTAEGRVVFLGRSGFFHIVAGEIETYTVHGIYGLQIHDALFSADDCLWVADIRGGVYKIEQDGTRTQIDLSHHGASSTRVSRLAEGHDGTIWAVTVDNELARFTDGVWIIPEILHSP